MNFRYLIIGICKLLKDSLINNISNHSEQTLIICRDLKKFSTYKLETPLTKAEIQMVNSITNMFLIESISINELYETTDHGANKVMVDLLIQSLTDGLQDENIDSVEMYVGYDDKLLRYIVNYGDHNYGDSLVGFPIHWEPIDKLYHYYSVYRTNYKAFDEHTIISLCNATERYEKSKDSEKSIISYNGIVSEYVGALEYELRKLADYYDLVDKDNTLYELIVKFQNQKSFESSWMDELVTTENTSKLHWLRKLRNDIDHGNRSATKEEVEELHETLFDFELLKLISYSLSEKIGI